MIKLSGIEWNEFLADEEMWKDGGFMEDETATLNGEETEAGEPVNPTDTVTISGGVYYPADAYSENGRCLETTIREWRRKRSTATCLVRIPKGKQQQLKALLKSIGGRLL